MGKEDTLLGPGPGKALALHRIENKKAHLFPSISSDQLRKGFFDQASQLGTELLIKRAATISQCEHQT